MSTEQFIASRAVQAVKALYGADVEQGVMQIGPTRKDFEGDYTLVVFPLLRISRKAPAATAQEIGEWLTANCPEISSFNAVQGFLNLCLSNIYWREVLEEVTSDPGFGTLPSTGRRVMVEFSSPNTNKPLHLGHIRNNLLGAGVSELLKAAGDDVIKATLVNDRGVHICKSMYAWEKLFDGATPESTGIKGDHLVGDCYVAFDKMYKAEVKQLMEQGMTEDEAKKARLWASASTVLITSTTLICSARNWCRRAWIWASSCATPTEAYGATSPPTASTASSCSAPTVLRFI